MLLEFCLEKELRGSSTLSKGEEKRKVTFRMGENETEIILVLIKKRTPTAYKKGESNS